MILIVLKNFNLHAVSMTPHALCTASMTRCQWPRMNRECVVNDPACTMHASSMTPQGYKKFRISLRIRIYRICENQKPRTGVLKRKKPRSSCDTVPLTTFICLKYMLYGCRLLYSVLSFLFQYLLPGIAVSLANSMIYRLEKMCPSYCNSFYLILRHWLIKRSFLYYFS
jgi:hypothetical protein